MALITNSMDEHGIPVEYGKIWISIPIQLRVPAETDRAAHTGGISAILRREGLYSSALTDRRRQREAGAFDALPPARHGRKTTPPNPLAAEMAALHRDHARIARRLARAEAIIEVQKKVAELLGLPLAPSDDAP